MADPGPETLYLLWHDPAAKLPDSFALHGDAHPLADGLWLVRSDLTRSKFYHRIKWQLPEGTALLCTPLVDEPGAWPKFKGLSSGAGQWLKAEV